MVRFEPQTFHFTEQRTIHCATQQLIIFLVDKCFMRIYIISGIGGSSYYLGVAKCILVTLSRCVSVCLCVCLSVRGLQVTVVVRISSNLVCRLERIRVRNRQLFAVIG